jgi:hypothetical protein
MRIRIAAGMWLGLLLAGCQGTYSQSAPIAAQPASAVCAGYGLRVGTTTFNQCVAYQEARAQAYPGQSVPPYRLDQYNNLVDAEGYRVDGTGHRMPVQSPYYLPMGQVPGQVSGQASPGQPILRDEYGNRYDARGNRI